jgi:formyltetrahydrofolate deformylase
MTTIDPSPLPVAAQPAREHLAPLRSSHRFVLTLSCPNRSGIMHAVTSFLAEYDFNIEEHQQFDDAWRKTLYLRTAFSGEAEATKQSLTAAFAPIAASFDMTFSIDDETPLRMLVMVSKLGHCLNDLIFRWRGASLGGELAVVVSNHETLRPMAEAAGLPFVHIPISADTKAEAEQRLLATMAEYNIDLVVLARYMQVLSNELCTTLAGRAINIHHSFLPGFKGARPYWQAYERGMKLVGATAHYVTPELDEGPIIEQEVIRVDHSFDPRSLAAIGQDAEALALSRAVRWHCERRVLWGPSNTVVFR